MEIMEIQKVMAVREGASEADKLAIDQALAVISNVFKELLDVTRHFLMTGERKEVELSEGMEALKVLKEKVGNDFPNIETEKEAKVYIVKFGKEIIFS